MNVQYISDNKGITTGVFIPIQEWVQIKESYQIPDNYLELSDSHHAELDYRIDKYLQNSIELLEWEDVKKRLLARKS
jgi:hypothetical protein